MNKKTVWMGMILAMVMLFLIAACTADQPVVSEPTQEPVTAAAEAPTETSATSAAMTDEEMIALITEKVAGHHDIDRVLNANMTRDEWEKTIDRMIAYGAQISDAEKTLIIDWLVSR